MSRILTGLMCVAVALAGVSLSPGAEKIYLELDGATQGAIEGEVTAQDFQDQIEVLDFHHLATRDYAIGGPKTHEEVIVTMRLNKAAVKLMNALQNQELLNVCIFHFLPVGLPPNEYYTIELTGGRISAIEPIAPNNLSQATADVARVRVAYVSMNLLHVPTGTGATLNQK